jgi:hypothetical protein
VVLSDWCAGGPVDGPMGQWAGGGLAGLCGRSLVGQRAVVWLFCGAEALQAHRIEAQWTAELQPGSFARQWLGCSVGWRPGRLVSSGLAVVQGGRLACLQGRGLARR